VTEWLRPAAQSRYQGYRRGVAISRRPGQVEPDRRLRDLDNFVGRWVAVKDGRVVAAADTSRSLVYELHKLGSSARGAVAQYVPPASESAMVGVG
jgi:hypothetical protein